MIDIMSYLHKYVPCTLEIQDQCSSKEKLYPLCFGGDQLSVARYRGSRLIRSNSTTPTQRLEGLVGVSEDWHAEVTLLKVYYMHNV